MRGEGPGFGVASGMNPDPFSIFQDLRMGDVQAAFLLAARAEEDSRPLYVESALLLARGPHSWTLAHAYRHRRGGWQWSAVFDADQVPRRDYDHQPTRPEVEKFVRDTWWKSKSGKGFRLLANAVPAQAWMDGLGFAPVL